MFSVAAYCRVSTDGKDQANSFVSQQNYFQEYIQNQKEWTLFAIYADEGITGTSTKKRVQFNRMIEDARSGKFQLILTKEVSRFARNILDTIFYTRELKALGIGVIFMNDSINTMEPDAELRLSILGSIAQEESRRTSQRVKWGQARRMEQGIVFGHSLLGYEVRHGCLTIEPQGAELVRLIFYRYAVEKQGSTVIARELSVRTGKSWSPGQIIRILKNEKYVGDLVQKKTYTPDYLSHAKKKNDGQEPIVILQNHHESIIDRELWNLAQEERVKRSRNPKTGICNSNQYGLSGKIYCGKCGSLFISKSKRRKNGSVCRRWCCNNGSNCGIGKSLRDTLAKEAVWDAISSCLDIKNDMKPDADDPVSEIFVRHMVRQITVYADRRLELLLTGQNHPVIFHFI